MERIDKVEKRLRRKKRIRKKVKGTQEKPRLCVFKSLKHIYAQLIDDTNSMVMVAVSSLSRELRNEIKYGGNVEAAKKVGAFLAKRALEKGIRQCVFDRNGFKYQGRVKALAEAAREVGLKF